MNHHSECSLENENNQITHLTISLFPLDSAKIKRGWDNPFFNYFNPLSANITKWSNTLKQFVSKLPTNCLSVFDHFMILALKGLR